MPPLQLRLVVIVGAHRTKRAPSSGIGPAPGRRLQLTHNLSLAQNQALDLARILMTPVTLFEINAEYSVMPSSELDEGEVQALFEYDPLEVKRAR